ncbi:CD3324 family protein [Virgibacillus litoralis]|uniref:DNA-binding NarL/FixJ family response regulator n=1 Tax=Virgibacillus litoralis TaxID=578221 RepID=A0ABS4HJ55_9BACI|nr:CD3324 family protein [Virgibacillus litoralis]MBP1950951.1 DNA-binding NarL/FixJ family response regulator [Virgibacillus litoralis]
MKYANANSVIPEELLVELQNYIQGEIIYIPKTKNNYEKWGTRSGGRKIIDDRNHGIRKDFKNGKPISQLAEEQYLSIETIKKIAYSKK